MRKLSYEEREDICKEVDRRVERLATFCHPSIRDHYISLPHPPADHLINFSNTNDSFEVYAYYWSGSVGMYNYTPHDMAAIVIYNWNKLDADLAEKTMYSKAYLKHYGIDDTILNYMTHSAFHEIGHYLYYRVFNECLMAREDEMMANQEIMEDVFWDYPTDYYKQWKAYHSLRNEKYANDFGYKWMQAFNY